jgi:ribonuclease P protein component
MRTEFFAWKKTATKTTLSQLTLYHAPSQSPQVAVVIPKKILKLATHRNSLKRVLLDKLFASAQARQESMVLFLRKTNSSPNLKNFILDELDNLIT